MSFINCSAKSVKLRIFVEYALKRLEYSMHRLCACKPNDFFETWRIGFCRTPEGEEYVRYRLAGLVEKGIFGEQRINYQLNW